MLDDAQLLTLLRGGESVRVERTRGTIDRDKFGRAICAFANDLPDTREPGVLFVGVNDDGSCAHTEIDERLIQTLLGFRTDGTITPLPSLSVSRVALAGCTMAAVIVQPSDNPPVEFDGRVCVRVGPRRGFATGEEERRLTEKRRWGLLPFEQQPVAGSSVDDLDLVRFRDEYVPEAFAPDVLESNDRTTESHLRALRFVSADGTPTVVGLLVAGRDPRRWLAGAYVQFVRYPGDTIGDVVQDQREVDGRLADLLRRLDELLEANIQVAIDMTGARERRRATYPLLALRELVRNAVIHRSYEGTTAPVRLTWFPNRVEITSPGGPFGTVTLSEFGQTSATDYRNPALAAAAKDLGFVQRFGSGIPRARRAVRENGNPPPLFRAEHSYVNVEVRAV